MNSFEKGIKSEDFAKNILSKRNIEIIGQRIKNKFGEIDILGKKDDTYYIFEIKYRKTLENAAYSIQKKQVMRSVQAFFHYVEINNLSFQNYQFAVFLITNEQYKIIILNDDSLLQDF